MHHRICHVGSPIAKGFSSFAPPTVFPPASRATAATRTSKTAGTLQTFHPPPHLRRTGSVSSHRTQRKKRRQPLHRRAHFLLELRDLFRIQAPTEPAQAHHALRSHAERLQLQHAADLIPGNRHLARSDRQHATSQFTRVAQLQFAPPAHPSNRARTREPLRQLLRLQKIPQHFFVSKLRRPDNQQRALR